MVVSVVALAACGSGRTAAPNPLAPAVYLNHALDLMRKHAVYTPTSGWKAVIAESRKMALSASAPEGTYGPIRYVVEQLRGAGDLHAAFFYPAQVKEFDRLVGSSGTAPTPPPTVSLLDHRLGMISLPGIVSPPKSPSARRYVSRALSAISALERKDHPCGWIVDLRGNTGGDMYPMLLGVGPVLGNGRLIGFAFRTSRRVIVSYRDGVLASSDGNTVQAPVREAPITPAPPVAVLIGPMTVSSGEAVTVAFRGRPRSRSFGLPTAGAPNSPVMYHLADGAGVRVSVALDVDRQGHVYRRPIDPDVTSVDAEAAAQTWLLSTTACTRTH
jgi:carboxyl-terminal processing protease